MKGASAGQGFDWRAAAGRAANAGIAMDSVGLAGTGAILRGFWVGPELNWRLFRGNIMLQASLFRRFVRSRERTGGIGGRDEWAKAHFLLL
jgi:hypothetical protein